MWFWILQVVISLVGLIALFALVAILIGLRNDKNHVVSRTIRLKQPPETIWAVISCHANEPSWQPHVKSSRRLPDHHGQR